MLEEELQVLSLTNRDFVRFESAHVEVHAHHLLTSDVTHQVPRVRLLRLAKQHRRIVSAWNKHVLVYLFESSCIVHDSVGTSARAGTGVALEVVEDLRHGVVHVAHGALNETEVV